MKKIFFITLLLMTSACSKEAVTADVALETENQKTLYAIGMIISNQLQTFALSEEELAPIVQGMMDGIKGEPRSEERRVGKEVRWGVERWRRRNKTKRYTDY